MPIISCLSQKGGAGKSTLARGIAVEFARNGWTVQIADLDEAQRSTFNWARRREDSDLTPPIEVALYANPKAALRAASLFDLLVVDGKPYASAQTLELAQSSDLVVIPTGTTVDDLEPALGLATELSMKGVKRDQIIIAVMKAPTHREAMDTQSSIRDWGFKCPPGFMEFKASYGKAMDTGRAMTETQYASTSRKSDRIIQFISDQFAEISNG